MLEIELAVIAAVIIVNSSRLTAVLVTLACFAAFLLGLHTFPKWGWAVSLHASAAPGVWVNTRCSSLDDVTSAHSR